MITELNKQDFYKVRHLTDKCRNIEPKAIVNGMNPGRVYADHPEKPGAVLIWTEGQQGFQIVGDAQSLVFTESLGEYMRKYIEPKLKEQGVNYVEIGADKDTWDDTLQTIFRNRDLSAANQHVFGLRENWEVGAAPVLTDAVSIRKMDAELLKSGGLTNHTFLEEKILHFWDTVDTFLEQGLGYLAERDNHVVSVCFSAFIAGQTHAIDIGTLEGYRRSNYGTAVAHALVQEYIQRGIEPYWDCTPENTGSKRIAEAVGLAHDFDYRIFWYGIG